MIANHKMFFGRNYKPLNVEYFSDQPVQRSSPGPKYSSNKRRIKMKNNFWKRSLCIIFAFMLVFAMAACGGDSGEGQGEDEGGGEVKKEVTYLSMGTGGVSGTWYPVGGVLAGAMSKSGTVSVTAQSSAASLENIRLAGTGERQLGMATGGLLVFAQEGIEMFEGEAYPQLRSLANMMFMQCQFLVREGSGIESLSDLAGKNVGTGAPGSGDEVFARGILEAVGVYDKVNPMKLSYAEQATAFKDRQLDAIFAMASAPTAAIMDAASQASVKMLPIDGADKAKVLEKYPFFVDATLTSDQYSFITQDINTIGSFTTLFTTTDVEDDVIYDAMKAMFSDLDTIQASHASMADFTEETAVMGLPVELHPGAERYYKEVGVID
jgi:TRAP transporter TAXI family solute receptor